jgi:biopolymer transport protein ExbD
LGIVRFSGGRYRLDIDVLSDTSVLNKGNPRLRIEADWAGYNRRSELYDELSMVSGMLVLMGGVWLLLLPAMQTAERSTALEISAAPHLGPQSGGPLRRFPRRALFSGLPSYGLCAGLVLSLLAISMYVVTYTPPPVGIWVLTSDRSLKTPRYGQSDKPLVLRIDKENRWFLDGKPVSPEEFPGALKKVLDRRLDWVVYLNASPELELGAPARAMDMIQGLHAKIILVTPSTEKDCCTGSSNR